MTTEVRPLSDLCQMVCDYCYQEPVRAAGNFKSKYSMSAMKTEIDRVGTDFALFGGEALLVPKDDLEELFRYGFENYEKNGIQTNGALIDDDHIAMFLKYNVSVGVSIDGPNELNGLRRVRKDASDEVTLENTKVIMENIARLAENGVSTSVIITLHRVNGNKEVLPRLMKFIRWLGNIGIVSGNIHTLEVDKTMPNQDKNVLTQQENAQAMITLAEFMQENTDLHWSPFTDIKHLLMQDGEANCTWNFCDPMNTQAVYGIEGDGALSNCGRTNKEGIGWYKANDNQYNRYISLFNTPQDKGGCNGCKFFMVCGGHCPGEAEDNDFRNKTIHCHTQKSMLSFYEELLISEGKEPITVSPLRPTIEHIMLNDMTHGGAPSLPRAIAEAKALRQDHAIVSVESGD